MDVWQTLRGPPKPRDIQVCSNFFKELKNELERENLEKHKVPEEPHDFLSYKPGVKVKKVENKFGDISQISILQASSSYKKINPNLPSNCDIKKQQIEETRIGPKFDGNPITKFNKPILAPNLFSDQNSNSNFYFKTLQSEIIQETPNLSRINPNFDRKSNYNSNNPIKAPNLISGQNSNSNSNFKTQQTEIIEESPYLSCMGAEFDKKSDQSNEATPNWFFNKNSNSNFYFVPQQSEIIEETAYVSSNFPKFAMKSDSSFKKPIQCQLSTNLELQFDNKIGATEAQVSYNLDKIYKPSRHLNTFKEGVNKEDSEMKSKKVVNVLQNLKFTSSELKDGHNEEDYNKVNKEDSKKKFADFLEKFKFTAESSELKDRQNEENQNKVGGNDKDKDITKDRLTKDEEELSQLSEYENDWCVSREFFFEIFTPDEIVSLETTKFREELQGAKLKEETRILKSQDVNANISQDIISPTRSTKIRSKITDFFTKAKRKSQSSLENGGETVKQKRIKFCTPYKSQFQELEVRYEVEQLKEENCAKLKRKISECYPVEIAFDIIFREGFCQLSKTSTNKLNGKPAGILLGIFWVAETVDYHYLEIATSLEQDLRNFLLYLLSPKLTCRKICYDSKTLFKLLLNLSLPQPDLIKSDILDLLVGTWLLKPETPPGSFNATQAILGTSIDHKVTSSDAVIKACHLMGILSKFVEKMICDLQRRGMFEVFVKVECKIPAILADMEFRGVRVDKLELMETTSALKLKIKDCEVQASGIMGRRVSLNSTVDIKRALYEELKLNERIKSPMKESTCEKSLLLLKELHPLPSVVLSYRNLQRKSARAESIWRSVRGQTLHSIWDQTTATGRVVSRSPNLQAISEENLLGLKAGGDYVLLAIDFSHVELRMFAHLAQDCELLALLREENGNLFEKLGGAGRDQRETKKIVYTLMQGMGPFKLADALKVDADVARSIYLEFTAKFPGLKKFPQSIINSCKQVGYVTSICGRRRDFSDLNNQNYGRRTHCEYQVINFCTQASTADFIKSAAIHLFDKLLDENLECHLVLVTHESIILEVSDEAVDKISDRTYYCRVCGEKTTAHLRYQDDVSDEVQQERLLLMIRLYRQYVDAINMEQIGSSHLVLMEEPRKRSNMYLAGRTILIPRYFRYYNKRIDCEGIDQVADFIDRSLSYSDQSYKKVLHKNTDLRDMQGVENESGAVQ